METCRKYWKKIIGLIVILICGIQIFRYIFPPFEITPGTITVQEDTGIELEVKHSLGIYEHVTHYGTHDEVKHFWGKYEYILSNNTSDDMGYGNAYILQVKRGAEWKNVMEVVEVGYTLEMHHLPTNSSVSGDLNLNFIYGKLPVGKYRIVKDVSLYDSVGGPIYNIAGEFRVWF